MEGQPCTAAHEPAIMFIVCSVSKICIILFIILTCFNARERGGARAAVELSSGRILDGRPSLASTVTDIYCYCTSKTTLFI